MNYNISSVLKQLRKTSGYSANDTIDKLKEFNIDISVKTLYGYESGLSMPNANVFVALCKVYHCDNPMVFFGNASFDNSELVLLNMYRALDNHGKELVDSILYKELDRCSAEYSPAIRQYFPASNDPDISYFLYRKDYVEEYCKGSTTNRFFDLVDVSNFFNGELSVIEFKKKALTQAEIDARFSILDSFSKKVIKPTKATTDVLVNAAHESTYTEVTEEMKASDNKLIDEDQTK